MRPIEKLVNYHPDYASVSVILSKSMSPSSEANLERWKRNLVAKLGPEGFETYNRSKLKIKCENKFRCSMGAELLLMKLIRLHVPSYVLFRSNAIRQLVSIENPAAFKRSFREEAENHARIREHLAERATSISSVFKYN